MPKRLFKSVILGAQWKEKETPPPIATISIDKPSELKIALDNRAFEIQMFWQRSNYFLVLITAIGVAVFSVKQPFLAALLSVFAALSSFYWYRTNLGSKFWQESWEQEVVKLANEEKIASFERSTSDIVDQVRLSLKESWTSGEKSSLQQFVDGQVITKPSVSYYMILLSITSTLIWICVATYLFAEWLVSFAVGETLTLFLRLILSIFLLFVAPS